MKQIEGSVEEPYVKELQSEIARIRSDRKGVNKRVIYLIIWVLFMLLVVGGVVANLDLSLGKLVTSAVLTALLLTLILWLRVYVEFVNGMNNSVIVCPHCEAQIVTTRIWLCGWCSHRNSSEFKTIFDGCQHKSCQQKPNAMRCPECSADIVLRERSYSRERGSSTKRVAGVAKLLEEIPYGIEFLDKIFGRTPNKAKEKKSFDDLDEDIG